eukprot:scaffold303089_cov32-Tisochrysis_lutea.AAC.5
MSVEGNLLVLARPSASLHRRSAREGTSEVPSSSPKLVLANPAWCRRDHPRQQPRSAPSLA